MVDIQGFANFTDAHFVGSVTPWDAREKGHFSLTFQKGGNGGGAFG